MKMSQLVRQHVELAKWMFFPIALLNWLFGLGMLFLLLGDWVLWHFQNAALLGLGSGFIGVYLITLIFNMSWQMVAMASSRQFYFLHRLRLRLSLMLLLFCTLSSLFCTVYLYFSSNQIDVLKVFLVGHILFSAAMMVMIFFGVYWPKLQYFAFTGFLFSLGVSHGLLAWPVVELVILLIAMWSLFLLFWFKWKPLKFIKTIQESLNADKWVFIDAVDFSWLMKLFSAKPASLLGSQLQGSADGWRSSLARGGLNALLLTIALLVMHSEVVSIHHAFAEDHVQDSPSVSGTLPFMFAMFLLGLLSIILTWIRGLHRVWMFSIGSRASLFCGLERQFFIVGIFYLLPPLVVMGIFLMAFAMPSLILSLMILFALSIVVALIAFYMSIVLYKVGRGAIVWQIFAHILVMIASGFAIYFVRDFYLMPTLTTLVLVFSALLLCALVSRVFALHQFRYTDIVRLK